MVPSASAAVMASVLVQAARLKSASASEDRRKASNTLVSHMKDVQDGGAAGVLHTASRLIYHENVLCVQSVNITFYVIVGLSTSQRPTPLPPRDRANPPARIPAPVHPRYDQLALRRARRLRDVEAQFVPRLQQAS